MDSKAVSGAYQLRNPGDITTTYERAILIVAVPVAAEETCEAFRDIADEIVCAETPEPFLGVGRWYADFSQTTDEEVHELLERARGGLHATV